MSGGISEKDVAQGMSQLARSHENVTILFMDIVGGFLHTLYVERCPNFI